MYHSKKQKVQEFIASLQTGHNSPIAFGFMYLTILTTFKILDSLATGQP